MFINAAAVELDAAIPFVDSAKFVLDIISILGTLITVNGGFMPLMAHCCLYSIIEMMQADAKIANSKIQNNMRMVRRNSRHHGSSIYK